MGSLSCQGLCFVPLVAPTTTDGADDLLLLTIFSSLDNSVKRAHSTFPPATKRPCKR